MSKTTVLVVEDEVIVAENLSGKLARLGYEVSGTAVEGEEAIEMALRLRPQLVLMDIRLKGRIDGIQAAEEIRARYDVPVIYLTAHSDPATLARAKITGPVGYILKPFEMRDLETQIELALYKHEADRQVREQRELLRVTLSSIGDAVIASDAEGLVAFLNPVAESLTGWKQEEAIGKPVEEVFRVINEYTRKALEDPVEKVIRTGKIVGLANHTVLLRRGGGETPIDDSGAPIVDDEGNIRGAVLVFRDITERKAAQEALRQSEERFRTLAESAPVGIVIADRNEKPLFINRWFAEHIGYALEEIPSLEHWWLLAYPDESQRETIRSKWTAAVEEATRMRIAFEPMEFPVACKDGGVRDIEFNFASTGELNFVLLTDVTRRRQAERAVRESAENLRVTLQSIGDAVIATDLEGRVTRMNSVAEALTGWTMETATGRSIEDVFRIFNAKTGERVPNPVKKVLETGKIVGLANHTKLVSKDGKEYQISDSGSPIKDDSGRLIGVVLVFRDATESYRMREAVERERRILRLFVEHAPAAIAMFDREMRYVSASRRFLADYDLGEQDIVGRSHYEVFPEIPERIKQVHRRCLAGAVERCDEDPFSRASGKLEWVRWEVRPWHEATGDIGGIVLFSEVVTESKRNKERIEHANQVLRAIRGVNQLIAYEKDRDALLSRACEILVETRGYRFAWIALLDNAGELLVAAESGMGEGFAAIRAELERGRQLECHRRAMDSENGVVAFCSNDFRCGACPLARKYRDSAALAGILRHGSREYGMLVVALPARMADDGYEKSLFKELVDDLGYALHGIEQRQQRERAEEKYRVLFEASSDGILIADIETKKMKYANPAICRFFGYSASEFENLGLADIHPKAELPNIVANFEKQARGETTLTPDVPCLGKDGTLVYADVNAVPIEIDGRACLAGFFRDITARKRAEEEREKLQAQLFQAQKMESVGRLAGGVAHDYNNVLSVIIGYAELALEKVDPSDELHDDLKEIHSAAGRSRDITRQLLAFARKETIAPEVLDLNATVENLLRILRRLIGEDIDLAWFPGKRLWPVLMDPSQLDQILANLCVNARDAIADVGKIVIETGTAVFDETYCKNHPGFTPGDFVVLSVSDDGCGMDRETMVQIFEPFFTTKEVGQGTGLGLATVYGIVKQNNGFVNVYSEPNQGTTFRIYLPRHSADISENSGETKVETSKGRGETLLLVEDDVSILKMAERMLSRLNYKVLAAETPGEALRLAEIHAGKIDLLITDVVMPEMNGRELAERIKNRCPDLKCLYMSGYTANIIAHRGVIDKGVMFVQKPFSTKALSEKVKAALDAH